MTKKVSAVLALLCACSAPQWDAGDIPFSTEGKTTLSLLPTDALTEARIEGAKVSVQVKERWIDARTVAPVHVVESLLPGLVTVKVEAEGYHGFLATLAIAPLPTEEKSRTLSYKVLLYPQRVAASGFVFHAFDKETGDAVESAELLVFLDEDPLGAGGGGTPPDDDVWPLLKGYSPEAAGTIKVVLKKGVGAIPAESLISGARYRVVIQNARNANGEGLFLDGTTDLFFRADEPGRDSETLFLSRETRVPTIIQVNTEPWLRWLIGISELMDAIEDGEYEDEDDIPPFSMEHVKTGYPNLQVRFPHPIELCGDPSEYWWYNGGSLPNPKEEIEEGYDISFDDLEILDTNYNGVVTLPAPENPIRLTLSEEDTLLTVNYLAEQEDPGDGLLVYFVGIQLRYKDSTGCWPLEGLSIRGNEEEEFPPLLPVRHVDEYPPLADSVKPTSLDSTNGSLEVYFRHPVEICSEESEHTWVNLTDDGPADSPQDSNWNGVVTQPSTIQPVSVYVDEFDEDTRLWPMRVHYMSDLSDTGDTLVIRFEGIKVRAVGTKACVPLEEVALLSDSGEERVSTVLFAGNAASSWGNKPVALDANNRGASAEDRFDSLVVSFPYPVEQCNLLAPAEIPYWKDVTEGDSYEGYDESRAATVKWNEDKTSLELKHTHSGDPDEALKIAFEDMLVKNPAWPNGACLPLKDIVFYGSEGETVETTIHVRDDAPEGD